MRFHCCRSVLPKMGSHAASHERDEYEEWSVSNPPIGALDLYTSRCVCDPKYSDTIVKVKIKASSDTRPSQIDPSGSPNSVDRPATKRRRICENELSESGIYNSGTTEEEPTEVGVRRVVYRSFFACAYSLASGSAFFKTTIDRSSRDEGIRRVIEVEVDGSELSIFIVLLKFLHTKEAPKDVAVRDFVDLLRIANRFLVHGIVGHCVDGLIAKGVGWRIASELLEMLYTAGIKSMPEIRSLLDVLDKILLSRFEDLDVAWSVAEDRNLLLHLPMPTLKSLLLNPALKVAAEETVFMVVSKWLQVAFGSGPKVVASDDYGQAVLQLGNCIRFPQISPYYLQRVVLFVSWTEGPNWAARWWIKEGLQFHLSSPQKLKAGRVGNCRGNRFLPRPASSNPKLVVTWEGIAKTFRDEISNQHCITGKAWHRGHAWYLQCSQTTKGGIRVGVVVKPLFVAMSLDALGRRPPMPRSVRPKKVVFEVATRSGTRQQVRAVDDTNWLVGRVFVAKEFLTTTNDDKSLEFLTGEQSELVVDGRIKVSATMEY
ncbi:unnamed protein product [Ostreobium quekettii]|uniref:BTB/POZ domain-containing protein n=1 Tax=Ostreobium quekettii TaxID=121088 RepID=A0A8S1IXZ3_9CHLO|nr:unnamed protein product [Ostreobium quekettii]|eukprot:evm.model.scf_160EXC.9 EVM.evm.TU.scf_160EXC.9   scf_160EXC:123411-125671(-)